MENEINKILKSIPDKFKIVENGISFELQKEYIDISGNISIDGHNKDEIDKEIEELVDSKTEIQRIKEIIVILGNIGTIKTFRVLEEFHEHTNNELKAFTLLAIQENIMFLENEIGDESTGIISSGLGGKGDKLRYYFVVISQTVKSFTEQQKRLIEIEYETICKKHNTVIEKIDFKFDYAELTILMPLDVALDTIVTGGIKSCNEFGNFIVEFYYATNMEIPTIEELQKIINKELRG